MERQNNESSEEKPLLSIKKWMGNVAMIRQQEVRVYVKMKTKATKKKLALFMPFPMAGGRQNRRLGRRSHVRARLDWTSTAATGLNGCYSGGGGALSAPERTRSIRTPRGARWRYANSPEIFSGGFCHDQINLPQPEVVRNRPSGAAGIQSDQLWVWTLRVSCARTVYWFKNVFAKLFFLKTLFDSSNCKNFDKIITLLVTCLQNIVFSSYFNNNYINR